MDCIRERRFILPLRSTLEVAFSGRREHENRCVHLEGQNRDIDRHRFRHSACMILSVSDCLSTLSGPFTLGTGVTFGGSGCSGALLESGWSIGSINTWMCLKRLKRRVKGHRIQNASGYNWCTVAHLCLFDWLLVLLWALLIFFLCFLMVLLLFLLCLSFHYILLVYRLLSLISRLSPPEGAVTLLAAMMREHRTYEIRKLKITCWFYSGDFLQVLDLTLH